ncbi:protein kinase [candidate division KSB1 bacterium]|nr:protein kinase [candidate division KSB1 bacterium]
MMGKSKLLGGKYEIISEIKRGGFGIVYYGFDRNLGKSIAIKKIAPELLEEAKYIDMFQEEAKNAAKLSHHNIVHIFDLLKTDDGHFYIIMEYIDGVDLNKIIKKSRKLENKISINLATYIIGEICKALEYAHNRRDSLTNEPLNLIHQDVSPSNIMISMKGDVKLIDFGIARVRMEQKAPANKIVLRGKLPYMSPEQLNGDFLLDNRSDIFSLGAVFFELISGHRLFQDSSDDKIIETIRSFKLDIHAISKNGVPDSIQDILAKTLNKNPDDRYGSANLMYLDLAQYLMESSNTIELSTELGDFVKQLFVLESSQPPQPPLSNEPGSIDEEDPTIMTDETLSLTDIETFAKHISTGLNTEKSESEATEPDPEKEQEIDISTLEDDFSEFESEPASDSKQFDIKDLDLSATTLKHDPEKQETPDRSKEPEIEIPLDLDIQSPEEQPVESAQAPRKTFTPRTDEPKLKTPVEEKLSEKYQSGQKPVPTLPVQIDIGNEDEDGDDDVKTVIDVLRLSSRTHKKQIFSALAVMGIFSVLFLIFDSLMGWTSFGQKMYDRLFPPAIRIISIPAGARVSMDGNMLEGKTPLPIKRITPGIHTLKLTYPGFEPIIKSIQVQNQDQVQVEGNQQQSENKDYTFQFMAQIELTSIPEGAAVYLNDVKINQQTPCTIEWEAGKLLSIEMEKSGFEKLSGFNFNALEMQNDAETKQFWSIKKEAAQHALDAHAYKIQGIFRKLIRVSSLPAGARIYLDKEAKPVGVTGSGSYFYATLGLHEIELKKKDYLTQKITFEVTEESSSLLNAVLHRRVKITATDITESDEGDINARIIRLIQNRKSERINKQTPCTLTLPPYTYKILLKKDGYADALVTIKSYQKSVVAKMEPNNVYIEISVYDAVTKKPISEASVKYRDLSKARSREKIFDTTGADGKCGKKLPQGQYLFTVEKKDYFEKRSNYTTVLNSKNRLQFNLMMQ